MIDLTDSAVTHGLHVALGALFVTFPVAYGWPHARLIGSCSGVVFAIIKEMWYDIEFEDPQTSGGFKGGCKDMMAYFLGIALADLLLLL